MGHSCQAGSTNTSKAKAPLPASPCGWLSRLPAWQLASANPWAVPFRVRWKHIFVVVFQLPSCLRTWDPMDCSTPGFPVPHHLLEFAQVHVHKHIFTHHPFSIPLDKFLTGKFHVVLQNANLPESTWEQRLRRPVCWEASGTQWPSSKLKSSAVSQHLCWRRRQGCPCHQLCPGSVMKGICPSSARPRGEGEGWVDVGTCGPLPDLPPSASARDPLSPHPHPESTLHPLQAQARLRLSPGPPSGLVNRHLGLKLASSWQWVSSTLPDSILDSSPRLLPTPLTPHRPLGSVHWHSQCSPLPPAPVQGHLAAYGPSRQ